MRLPLLSALSLFFHVSSIPTEAARIYVYVSTTESVYNMTSKIN